MTMGNSYADQSYESLVNMFNILKEKGIDRFYHFTDVRNLPSILECNCLFSRKRSNLEGITINFPGGNEESWQKDCLYQLDDYVRLSFCYDHPMMYRLQQENKYKLVILGFNIEVLEKSFFGFSDRNATAHDHRIEYGPHGLAIVNLDATQRHYLKKEDPDFGFHQAEILIKSEVSLDYLIDCKKLY